MSRPQPVSVTRAIQLLLGLVALGAVAAALTVVLGDDLVRSWAGGNASARAILAEDGLEALKDSPITPAFAPVAVVLFLVFVALAWVLIVFLREGHNWARYSIAVTVALGAFATLALLRTDLPTIFVVLAVLSLGVEAVLLVCLWHRDTTAFLRGAWSPTGRDA